MLKKLSALIGSLLLLGNNSCSNRPKETDSDEKASLIERLKLALTRDKVETEEYLIENAMCYDPIGPSPEIKPCSVCGNTTELAGFYHSILEDLIVTLARNGYESEEGCFCYDCLKKLIDSGQIITDLKDGEEFTNVTQYAILRVRKRDEESYRQVVITHDKNITDLEAYLKKKKNGETKAATAEEIAAFELLTGDRHTYYSEKEEIKKRLKEVAKEQVPTIEFKPKEEEEDNAMCYSPAIPELDEPAIDDEQIHIRTEKKASYPGGEEALMDFLSKNMVYPKQALEQGFQGRVIVQFTVNKDGSIQDVTVLRPIKPSLDAEAIRLVNMMGAWQPATIKNIPVRSKTSLVISFKHH